jgi:hypothetical protein
LRSIRTLGLKTKGAEKAKAKQKKSRVGRNPHTGGAKIHGNRSGFEVNHWKFHRAFSRFL